MRFLMNLCQFYLIFNFFMYLLFTHHEKKNMYLNIYLQLLYKYFSVAKIEPDKNIWPNTLGQFLRGAGSSPAAFKFLYILYLTLANILMKN